MALAESTRRCHDVGLTAADLSGPGAMVPGVAGEMTTREYPPCEVCGEPTISAGGVCKKTLKCRNERDRRRERGVPKPVPERRPCSVCGRPTANRLGVCAMTPDCKRVHNHLFWRSVYPEPDLPPCAVCGRPTGSVHGVCQSTAECRQELSRRVVAATTEAVRERKRTYARRRYWADPDARHAEAAEYRARNLAASRARSRAYQRGYMRRPGRPCRYARALGCAEFAAPGCTCCPAHHKLAAHRRRVRFLARLAGRQAWMCPWCAERLPADLAGVHVDHIIPVTAGGPDEEWNFQVLHGPCNRAKWSTITAEAVILAAEHGIELAAASRETWKQPDVRLTHSCPGRTLGQLSP
jgi:5-methylcytosine-specific restriction endonuclease McrA